MKKTYKYLIITLSVLFLFLIWLTNFTVVGYFFKRHYTFSNYNGSYQFTEGKANPFASSNPIGYYEFLKKNPNIKDKKLYRTFTLDIWRFWEWNQWYCCSSRFKLPYISEEEIQENIRAEKSTINK